jgi:hypothetical protein
MNGTLILLRETWSAGLEVPTLGCSDLSYSLGLVYRSLTPISSCFDGQAQQTMQGLKCEIIKVIGEERELH